MIKARIAVAAILVMLAGCNKSATDKQGKAGGQILPGSASDAMLPLDTVTSQPPLAPKQESGPGTTASEAPDAAASAAPAEAPAEAAKPAKPTE